MRPVGSPDELERRRRRALQLLTEGYRVSEVASMVGADRRSIARWQKAKKEGGIRAIRAKPAPGRPPKLRVDQRTELEAILLRGARACGYSTDLWTCPRIVEVVADRFDVHYHVDHIPKVLRQLGWSVQAPTRRAIERDEAAIRRWVKKEWPRVKKTPAGRMP